jgi:muramoyltetrapeptide carboxypeptidase
MYNIDRLLFHMGHATQLQGLAGVRLGSVTAVTPNEPEWADSLEFMVRRWCGDLGVPYLGRADVGHTQGNRVVPFGIV